MGQSVKCGKHIVSVGEFIIYETNAVKNFKRSEDLELLRF